jgi:hypothetical protein
VPRALVVSTVSAIIIAYLLLIAERLDECPEAPR